MAVIPFPQPLIARRTETDSAALGIQPFQPTGNALIQTNAANPLDTLDFSLTTRIFANGISGANEDRIEYKRGLFDKIHHVACGPFCFPRIPATWAELCGFFAYCEFLWTAAGCGHSPAEAKTIQEFSRRQALRNQAQHVPALDAFIAGDYAELRRIHSDDGTLESLAESWQESPATDISENFVIPDYSISATENIFARVAFRTTQHHRNIKIDYARCLHAVEQLIGKGDDTDRLEYPKSVAPFMRKRIMRGHGFGRLPATRAELNAFVHYAYVIREVDGDAAFERKWVRGMPQN